MLPLSTGEGSLSLLDMRDELGGAHETSVRGAHKLVYARNLEKGSDRVGTNLIGMGWELHLPSLLPSFLTSFPLCVVSDSAVLVRLPSVLAASYGVPGISSP